MYLPSFWAETMMTLQLVEQQMPPLSHGVAALALPCCNLPTIASGDRVSARTMSSEVVKRETFLGGVIQYQM